MFVKSIKHRLKRSGDSSASSRTTKRHRASNKQRVDLAIIGGRGYHSSYGGVENAIRRISDSMVAEYALNICVYGTDSSEASGAQISGERLKFIYAPRFSYRFFGQHGATLACVIHALLITRPRVVLLFASGPSVFVPLFRLMGKPVITSLRAIDSARDKWGWISRKILQAGEYFAWKYSTSFTANSLEMINVFGDKRPDALFIPNGSVEAQDGESEIMRKFGLRNDAYFLFAARLDPVKRLHLLLQAHASIAQEDRLPLVVAGGHSKSEKYQQELQQSAASDVFFLGHISAQELDPLMRNCRAFLLPSVLEGMSNSLLSAMATGCAVLASDIAPNKDVLLNEQAMFSADDVSAMRDGLLRLAQQPEFARQLGAELQKHAQQTYSWQRTAGLFYSLIVKHLPKEHQND